MLGGNWEWLITFWAKEEEHGVGDRNNREGGSVFGCRSWFKPFEEEEGSRVLGQPVTVVLRMVIQRGCLD